MTHQQSLGKRGESLAVEHLTSNGYTIITTNWHCQYGELDIVATHHDEIVFVEVKTRRDANTERALASITPKKRNRLIKTAHLYLTDHNQEDAMWRIDAIAIAIVAHQEPIVNHVEDVLGW